MHHVGLRGDRDVLAIERDTIPLGTPHTLRPHCFLSTRLEAFQLLTTVPGRKPRPMAFRLLDWSGVWTERLGFLEGDVVVELHLPDVLGHHLVAC